MEKHIYEISEKGIEEIHGKDLPEMKQNVSCSYIIDIHADDRNDASNELQKLGLHADICRNITEPSNHIQFDYFGDALYGELAYFSPQTKKSDYTGIIIYKNILIGIHPGNEGVLSALIKPKTEFTEIQKSKISAEFLLYVIILEILSNYGKLIIASREKIETLALDLDKKKMDKNISPKVFLESKSHLSLFSRALEKLYFTLSFPPTKDVLDNDSLYENYFDYLLTNMNLIRSSLKRTEERLESLNDHYQLLLQSKANKRLNLLTIIQAVFVPLTLVVGVYGMNFVNMPELNLKYGYFITLALMAVVASTSLIFFKKNGWFD
jgi:magnesium transporter